MNSKNILHSFQSKLKYIYIYMKYISCVAEKCDENIVKFCYLTISDFNEINIFEMDVSGSAISLLLCMDF